MTKETRGHWKDNLYKIIFEADTLPGKTFDIALIFSIILSTLVVIVESISSIKETYGDFLILLEWFFVVIFIIEYILRIICVHNRWRYFISFYGIVDLLTILPAFISLFIPNVFFLMVIRVLRLLRLFRILKMVRYIEESSILLKALKNSRPKIIVFVFTIFFVITIVGSLMYVVEGPENGYTNIPVSMYWAIVTLSTVGYGDISPHTAIGKLIASTLMILAYGILAVPTGIISYEITKVHKRSVTTRTCPHCLSEGHAPDAVFCNKCGEKLP